MENCRILSVYSHKGGVGKTTLVDVIGNAASASQSPIGVSLKYRRCLMIDLDTQMNLTCKLLKTEENFQDYIDGLKPINDFEGNRTNLDIRTKLARLGNYSTRADVNPMPHIVSEEGRTRNARCVHLIPGFPEMAQIAKQMALELDQPGAPLNNCNLLRHLIQEYVNVHHYDLVVLDLGPDLYTINSCALWSSDYLLIPCTADIYSAMSFSLISNVIFPKEARERDPTHPYYRFGSNLKVLGFLPNRVKVLRNNPTQPQEVGIGKLHTRFADHLAGRFYQQSAYGPQPCFIQLIGGEITNNEEKSLIQLCGSIKDQDAKARLVSQLRGLITWLNDIIN